MDFADNHINDHLIKIITQCNFSCLSHEREFAVNIKEQRCQIRSELKTDLISRDRQISWNNMSYSLNDEIIYSPEILFDMNVFNRSDSYSSLFHLQFEFLSFYRSTNNCSFDNLEM